jgi:hypothetical protein
MERIMQALKITVQDGVTDGGLRHIASYLRNLSGVFCVLAYPSAAEPGKTNLYANYDGVARTKSDIEKYMYVQNTRPLPLSRENF